MPGTTVYEVTNVVGTYLVLHMFEGIEMEYTGSEPGNLDRRNNRILVSVCKGADRGYFIEVELTQDLESPNPRKFIKHLTFEEYKDLHLGFKRQYGLNSIVDCLPGSVPENPDGTFSIESARMLGVLLLY